MTGTPKRGRPALTLTALLLLAAGIALVLYPRLAEHREDERELRLLAAWSSQAAAAQPSPAATNMAAAVMPLPEWREIDGAKVLGTVSIDRIGISEPIVYGSDASALKRGAGTVVPDRLPGEPGNFVLAGHRSLTRGRHFNRLGEVAVGDTVQVDTSIGRSTYRVTTIKIVEPNDLSVLDDAGNGVSELTLVTCHPRKNPTHRLIVHAVLIQNSDGTGDL
ncbi:class D sortase [Cohnella hashimotonis]|uniref:Class D sortase n=1 Tax=Cohnella hashimotonis TaxID=2826895 RepID=A0ABT6TCZ0_9BACL|nr:class D sortase [Cohnella hashimotonis]MDI4644685.1 class D sortase [Cohnella hashimotonis]